MRGQVTTCWVVEPAVGAATTDTENHCCHYHRCHDRVHDRGLEDCLRVQDPDRFENLETQSRALLRNSAARFEVLEPHRFQMPACHANFETQGQARDENLETILSANGTDRQPAELWIASHSSGSCLAGWIVHGWLDRLQTVLLAGTDCVAGWDGSDL